MSNEKRLWIIEARDGAWGANGICKGELVRCKDCKWWVKQNVGGTCELNIRLMSSDNWYCADGKRKDISATENLQNNADLHC